MNKPLPPAEFAPPKVTTGPLPASRKLYSAPEAAPDLRVPLREIALDASSGEPPLPVYDTTGPYTDPDVAIDVEKGLKRTRIEWVRERGGVEDYEGRPIRPVDNGNVSGKHLARAFPTTHKPLRASSPPVLGRGWRRSAPGGAHPARMGARGRHHQGNDLHCRAREPRAQAAIGMRAGRARRRRELRRRRCRSSSRRSSCARKWRAGARSFPPTSTTPNSSR